MALPLEPPSECVRMLAEDLRIPLQTSPHWIEQYHSGVFHVFTPLDHVITCSQQFEKPENPVALSTGREVSYA